MRGMGCVCSYAVCGFVCLCIQGARMNTYSPHPPFLITYKWAVVANVCICVYRNVFISPNNV